MRELAEKIIEAIDDTDNTTYDEIEAVEEVLIDWQESQSKMNKYS